MLNGEITNEPAPIFLVDYRLLLETKTRFFFSRKLTLHPETPAWSRRNWEHNIVIFSVGSKDKDVVERLLSPYFREFMHFRSSTEFFVWVQLSKYIRRVITDDPALLGLDNVYKSFGGWRERII